MHTDKTFLIRVHPCLSVAKNELRKSTANDGDCGHPDPNQNLDSQALGTVDPPPPPVADPPPDRQESIPRRQAFPRNHC